jgi:hypothetical protein
VTHEHRSARVGNSFRSSVLQFFPRRRDFITIISRRAFVSFIHTHSSLVETSRFTDKRYTLLSPLMTHPACASPAAIPAAYARLRKCGWFLSPIRMSGNIGA